jgi:hypothetical protein
MGSGRSSLPMCQRRPKASIAGIAPAAAGGRAAAAAARGAGGKSSSRQNSPGGQAAGRPGCTALRASGLQDRPVCAPPRPADAARAASPLGPWDFKLVVHLVSSSC